MGTPPECVGLGAFEQYLLFWMALPAVACTAVFVGTGSYRAYHGYGYEEGDLDEAEAARFPRLERLRVQLWYPQRLVPKLSLPKLLLVFFFAYPQVSASGTF